MRKLNINQINMPAETELYPPRSNKNIGLTARLGYFLQMIDIGHSLFALPFAYLGAFLAAGGVPTFRELWWITLAMVGARTAALCLNRLIDRHLDARNPRTAGWILPRKLVPLKVVWGSILASFSLLFWAAAHLNPLCVKLAPFAVIVLVGYSYTKRFTWTCHLILGLSIGMGPLGAWIAIQESIAWTPILLSLAVAFWIAGFDMMYASQDEDFDRKEGLYSIPAHFGVKATLFIAAVLHVFTLLLLGGVGIREALGGVYFLGLGAAVLVLLYAHYLVKPQDLSKMHTAAFGLNRYVSIIIFLCTLVDMQWF